MRYEDAGVSFRRAEKLVAWLRASLKDNAGRFAARVKLGRTTLLLATDGVGTKILLALDYFKRTGKEEVLKWVGQDLVAMVSNDILAEGGRTLYFLDYYATGRLNDHISKLLIEGVLRACSKVGARLVGGETAELPGMLAENVFDIAGFGVGIPLLKRQRIPKPGDVLVALPSSGFHSNGYSLIRKILAERQLDITAAYPQTGSRKPLGELLLRPTKLYWRIGREMFLRYGAKSGAHITGGGVPENLPRALNDLKVELYWDRIKLPKFYRFILEMGKIPPDESRRVFNMGVGFVFVVPEKNVKRILSRFKEAFVFGRVL
ncbi:MAG: phosphoribosylformylglycinamidine cyclo-ligase [Thermotogae bacterium]|nr:phosphoribosylformylglycinamidine cyclo-ligase [Thermotogota bacterium]